MLIDFNQNLTALFKKLYVHTTMHHCIIKGSFKSCQSSLSMGSSSLNCLGPESLEVGYPSDDREPQAILG